jgi:rhomboid protease GluP
MAWDDLRGGSGAPIRGGQLLDGEGRPVGAPGYGAGGGAPAPTALPRPVVTIALITLCSLVFVGMVLSGVSIISPRNLQLWQWGANFGYYTVRGQWWRLITSAFVHIGLLHLLFNMWCLWRLGFLAELIFGRGKYLAIYLVCAVVSAMASIAWRPMAASAGASGAIFGIAGALLATFYFRKLPLPPSAARPMLRSLVTFAIVNLAFGSLVPGIDNAAHVGGFACGLVIGAVLPKRQPRVPFTVTSGD